MAIPTSPELLNSIKTPVKSQLITFDELHLKVFLISRIC
jgi:hypothetical protein